MKTKSVSKNRKKVREFKASIKDARDIEKEFGTVLDNSFIDEDAFAMCLEGEDDGYYL